MVSVIFILIGLYNNKLISNFNISRKHKTLRLKTKTKTKTLRLKIKAKTAPNRSRDVSRPRLKSRELHLWVEVVCDSTTVYKRHCDCTFGLLA